MGVYDDAYGFINAAKEQEHDSQKSDIKTDFGVVTSSEELVDNSHQLKLIYKKIDRIVLPVLCMVYFFQFIDKSLINYAGVMGIKKHLDDPDQFGDLATILYVGYIIFEPAITLCFLKLPFAKFFGASIIAWGVIVVLHIVCLSYSKLMAIRFFLGAVEATAITGVLICNGMWYSHEQQTRRFGIITSQVGTATIVGSLLSFGFQHVNPDKVSLESWQILFLVMGLLTIVFGVMVLVFLPDNPMNSKLFTKEEKLILLEHLKANYTGIENKTFKWAHVKEFATDKLTWILCSLTIITMISTGAINTFSVTIISSLGFTSKEAALMQMPMGLSSILSIVPTTYFIAYYGHRTFVFQFLLVVAIVGYIILLTSKNQIANLFGVYFANAGTCVITLLYSWNNRNTAGYTKRLIRNCATMICIAIGCLIGPQLFKTPPPYTKAKWALLALSIAAVPWVGVLGWLSKLENDKRDKLPEDLVDANLGEGFEYKDLTDQENLRFRYGY